MLADKTDETCGFKKKKKEGEPFPLKKLITVYRKPPALLLLSTMEEMMWSSTCGEQAPSVHISDFKD